MPADQLEETILEQLQRALGAGPLARGATEAETAAHDTRAAELVQT